MSPFRRTASDRQPSSPPGPSRRFQTTLLRRLLIGWLLSGAIIGGIGFLSLFDRRSSPEQLATAAVFGGLALVCSAVLILWLRVAMRRAAR